MHRGWQQITPKGEGVTMLEDTLTLDLQPIHITVLLCQSDSVDPASFWAFLSFSFAIGQLSRTSLALARLLKMRAIPSC